MNEKTLSILSTMFQTLPASKELVGARQIYFETDTHECSITVFLPQTEEEKRDMETIKRWAKNDNDIVWIDNVRFSATLKI